MSIDYGVVSERVRKARKMRGYTSEKLSEMVGFASESLRHIENGSSKPSLKKLYELAEALQVSMDYLTGRSPSFEDTVVTDSVIEQDLTDSQKRMLRKMVKDMLPTIKEFVD